MDDITKNKNLQKEIVELTKKRKPREDHSIQFNTGENNKYLNHAIQIYNLPSIDLNDPEQVKNRVMEYFNICLENDMPVSKCTVATY